MIFSDTHTHLYSQDFNADRDLMVKKAIDAGIKTMFLPNIDLDSIDGMFKLCESFPQNCFPMLGLHPCSVNQNYKSVLNHIELLIPKNKIYAIGEIGIDLYWDKTLKQQQIDAFKIQVEWAKTLKLPIVIHVRDAFEDVFNVIDQLNDDSLFGIFHCFTGDINQAKKIIDYGGFKLGIGGVVTFKNSGLDQVLEQIDLNHLVLETDSPYLAPTPYRGKRNESAYIINIAQKLADIYKVDLSEIASVTTKNAIDVFRI